MPILQTNKSKGTKPILPLIKNKKENEPKIINLAVHLEKLTAQLSDGRELSIPIE